jgi:hypothetical protein
MSPRSNRALYAPLFILAATLAACSTTGPPIGHPIKVEAYCAAAEARPTGVASVMTSTDDKLVDDRPTLEGIRREVKAGSGVIEYWTAQPLALPNVSKELGETDGYARVLAVAVPIAPATATKRHIYLDVRDHGYPRWITMNAFDVQNVCVEGRREA